MLRHHLIYSDDLPQFNLKKAEGSFIWNTEGKKFIDFTSGWNVTNLGWNHPEINQAVIDQIKSNSYNFLWDAAEIQLKYCERLRTALPPALQYIGRATGGTEANMEAIKTAKIYTGRKKIIGFRNAYHGQSLDLLSLGFLSKNALKIAPESEYFITLDFPEAQFDVCHEEILQEFGVTLEEELAGHDVAAILLEPGIITGGGSTDIAPPGFVRKISEIAKKYGTLLILDEVGSGFSRCGKLFGLEIEGIAPDILTLAKAIANGAGTLGAMITTEEIAKATHEHSSLTSTFGWTPPACAAALKTLEIHQREKIWQKAEEDGNYIVETLRNNLSNTPFITKIRGIGLEMGISFYHDDTAGKVVRTAQERGLYIIPGNKHNIQLMPALNMERKVLDQALDILIGSVRDESRFD